MRMLAMPLTVFYVDTDLGLALRYYDVLNFLWPLALAQSIGWFAVAFFGTIIAQVVVVVLVLLLTCLWFYQQSKTTLVFRKEVFHA